MTLLVVATFVVALVPIGVAVVLHRAVRASLSRRGLASAGRGALLGAVERRWVYGAAVLLGAGGGAVFGLAVSPALDCAFADWESALGPALVRYALAGPAAEELGKGLLLLGLFAAGRIRSTTEGVLLGVAAGAGFAALENFSYAIVALAEDGPERWIASLQVRVGLGTFVHSASTAILGGYLGAARASGRVVLMVAAPAAAIFAASAAHGVWNGTLLLADATANAVWAFGGLLWLAGLCFGLAVALRLDLQRLTARGVPRAAKG